MSYQSPEPPHPISPDDAPAGHPSPERLAALVDVAPSAAEARHLADCLHCRGELGALRAIVDLAPLERDRVSPPLTNWDALGVALRAEGLVRWPDAAAASGPGVVLAEIAGAGPDAAAASGPGVVLAEIAGAGPDAATVVPIGAGRERRRALGWAGRAAAVLLLAGGGLVAGRVSAGADPLPALVLGASPGRTVATILADTAPPPSSTDEAMAILTRAERDYRMATAYLADEAAPLGEETDRPELYQRRLAVMDEVASLTRAALTESPHDPVLNQYYLASLGAREATLRHLATALPTGAQLSRF